MSVDLMEEVGIPNRRLLDVGCGTGLAASFLADRGFSVTGCDISPDMVDIARGKGLMADVRLADMRSLPQDLAGFGVATWFGDVANHLLSEQDLAAALRSTAGALAPGGLLVFDVNNLSNYRDLFGASDLSDHGDVLIAWLGRTETAEVDGPAAAELIVFERVDGELWRRSRGAVQQRHYSMKTLTRLLDEAGLDVVDAVGLHGGRMVRPASEDDPGKIFYVARKR
ncbi:class I SAM-dependent DNA methyltransferase [Catellatospora tritici]|uniref:class I SAM-dependent DNA methyltransferase n=1 Tax=Catellatospora tritici TaxID=2851566 RepID=UPI001C2DD195|nr:class I SAM-dependent methyltransferase [Catellatospora tritici]MBV1851331.1 class I SAM-dependent methyltransferase [Catellatospora tritici]